MQKQFSILLLLLLCTSCTNSLKPVRYHSVPFEIELKKGPCYGTCPIYTIYLDKNHKVHYNGKRFVDSIGKYEWYVSKENYNEIYTIINCKDFKQSNSFNTQVQDLPKTSFYIYTETDTITIEYKGATPAHLKDKMLKIEHLLTKNAKWNNK